MGAPAREWAIRTAAACAVIALVSLVLRETWPVSAKSAVLAPAAVAGFWLAFRFLPGFDPLFRIRCRLPGGLRGERRCAITFDDGPSHATEAVLDILAAEHVPATFFILGVNAERYPDVIRRAQAEGHAVGIHGMTHAKLAGASEEAVEREVLGTMETLTRIGIKPSKVYRTPHGFKSRGVFAVARRHGLALWAWSRGVWDTDAPAPAVLVRRATRLAGSGMVLLLHDGRGNERHPDLGPMLSALPRILKELKRRGFTFVSLTELHSRV
jgi:peptidoglycan/xylan/chitin deacetylase (PgdA/CDA1 family)